VYSGECIRLGEKVQGTVNPVLAVSTRPSHEVLICTFAKLNHRTRIYIYLYIYEYLRTKAIATVIQTLEPAVVVLATVKSKGDSRPRTPILLSAPSSREPTPPATPAQVKSCIWKI
jgi:hypothetical protein